MAKSVPTTVVLPTLYQVQPAQVPVFSTPQVAAVTDLTRSQLVSLAQMRALRPDLAAPRGRGRGLRFSAANVVELSILQRLLSAGLRMREGLAMVAELERFFVPCEPSAWHPDGWLVLQPHGGRRARFGPASVWHPATLMWLTAEAAWLMVVRVPTEGRSGLVVRIVRTSVTLAEIPQMVGGPIASVLAVDLAAIGERLSGLIGWAAHPLPGPPSPSA